MLCINCTLGEIAVLAMLMQLFFWLIVGGISIFLGTFLGKILVKIVHNDYTNNERKEK